MKQVLTEGERYVMTLFSIMSFNQQGVYDVVNNLGSLAARFLFRPIEDSLYFYFSQSVKRDVDVKDQNQVNPSSRKFIVFFNILLLLGGLFLFSFSRNE